MTAALHVALASDPSDPRLRTGSDHGRRRRGLARGDRGRSAPDHRAARGAARELAARRRRRPRRPRGRGSTPPRADGGPRCPGRRRGSPDPRPRRLPSRPGAAGPRELPGHRLRGGAGAAPGRAARQARGPARRGRACCARFGYAARSVLREQPDGERAALAPWLDGWERLAGEAFRRGYLAAVGESAVRLVPPGDHDVRAVTRCSSSKRRCTSCATSSGIGPTGSTFPWPPCRVSSLRPDRRRRGSVNPSTPNDWVVRGPSTAARAGSARGRPRGSCRITRRHAASAGCSLPPPSPSAPCGPRLRSPPPWRTRAHWRRAAAGMIRSSAPHTTSTRLPVSAQPPAWLRALPAAAEQAGLKRGQHLGDAVEPLVPQQVIEHLAADQRPGSRRAVRRSASARAATSPPRTPRCTRC